MLYVDFYDSGNRLAGKKGVLGCWFHIAGDVLSGQIVARGSHRLVAVSDSALGHGGVSNGLHQRDRR